MSLLFLLISIVVLFNDWVLSAVIDANQARRVIEQGQHLIILRTVPIRVERLMLRLFVVGLRDSFLLKAWHFVDVACRVAHRINIVCLGRISTKIWIWRLLETSLHTLSLASLIFGVQNQGWTLDGRGYERNCRSVVGFEGSQTWMMLI